jgi:hypothetical protein
MNYLVIYLVIALVLLAATMLFLAFSLARAAAGGDPRAVARGRAKRLCWRGGKGRAVAPSDGPGWSFDADPEAHQRELNRRMREMFDQRDAENEAA